MVPEVQISGASPETVQKPQRKQETLEERFLRRLELLSSLASGALGDMLKMQFLSCEPEKGIFWFRAQTEEWMRNGSNTLHGGMGATILDQAMGGTYYCLKEGDNVCPTIEMQASYHRPIIPGKDVLLKVRVVSITRRLAHMAAEVYQADAPYRLCLSGTAIYFVTEQAAHMM